MASLSRSIPIKSTDTSQTGHARRQALSLAGSLGFDEVRTGQLGIIVTEAARNMELHADEGELVLSPWRDDAAFGIDVLALDRGKGIENIAASMQDGYSTSGTPGNGMGAMARLASTFQVYSAPGAGTAIFARVLGTVGVSEARPYALGAICLPVAGETMCGDAWELFRGAGRSVYVVADGLGHGPMAAEASLEAIRQARAFSQYGPERILAEIHGALAKTRGAAVSVAEILPGRQVLNYAGAGNIAASICTQGKTRSMVSMNGTVGHTMGRIQQFSYPWEKDSTLIMHSDGVSARWSLDQYPGLATRHPALFAGVLFRDFVRKRDDATIVVSRI
jgi:anti-sigma regulatory factor (Ser/Thr protein kinase)